MSYSRSKLLSIQNQMTSFVLPDHMLAQLEHFHMLAELEHFHMLAQLEHFHMLAQLEHFQLDSVPQYDTLC